YFKPAHGFREVSTYSNLGYFLTGKVGARRRCLRRFSYRERGDGGHSRGPARCSWPGPGPRRAQTPRRPGSAAPRPPALRGGPAGCGPTTGRGPGAALPRLPTGRPPAPTAARDGQGRPGNPATAPAPVFSRPASEAADWPRSGNARLPRLPGRG